MKSYLLSWLARKHAVSDLEAFARQHPGPWLVWEAGAWSPPPPDRGTLVATARRARPASGEALVLEVAPRMGAEGSAEVRIGRSPDNDLVVDDGTLSRQHFLLRPSRAGWMFEDLRSSNGSRVNGVLAQPGVPRPVPAGARIDAGAVTFTFYDSRGLHQRLRRALDLGPTDGVSAPRPSAPD